MSRLERNMPYEKTKLLSTRELGCLKRTHVEAFDDEDTENVQPFKQIHIYADDSLETSSSEHSRSPLSIYEISSLESPPNVFSLFARNTKGNVMLNDHKRNVLWEKFLPIPCGNERCTVETPLPVFTWAESEEVWQAMCMKDQQSKNERNPDMFDSHPGIQPRMRAILFDWLIEVCDVYKLHRETYYLAVDYIDRYLSGPRKVLKSQLQLIGITCLFIAAKIEEIYPPKISEFAYVTDTACTDEEILGQEIIILKALKWNITPITIVGWLSVYMQLSTSLRNTVSKEDKEQKLSNVQDSFILPQFSGIEFSQICKLLDLCSMDIVMASFSYSVIAASAMALTFNKTHAMNISGFSWSNLEPCVIWMSPYFEIIAEETTMPSVRILTDAIQKSSGLKHICPNLVVDESHTLQTHVTSIDMFDTVQLRLQEPTTFLIERSPAPMQSSKGASGLLTPPASSRKLIESATSL
ncbi:G1/S-specific cyclin-E [Ctenocephalides felis]|uniref:G1/S-specific cyclin-E n=1 Tax=Ctenocephalides felis TaxID=7515 RepID=UPI000E6E53C1|nr:G1/S-specific cyclin-E [Ctenocephalides felis]XP_026473082.1 G1/S-specific cyclin-E [Ctenocephalides felis]